MANNRVAIRAAVKSLLSGQTTAGTNVYTNRENNLWEASELPAIIIATPTEPVTPANLQGTRYNRTLTLTIEAKLEASATVDDDLDALLQSIETIISNNLGLSGTVQTILQTNTDTKFDSSGETEIAVGTLTYECKYSA